MFTILAVLVAQSPQSWSDIDKLVNEQKLEAAAKATDARLAAAQKGADDAELARALIKRTQLRIGLGGYETAVKQLKTEAWPKTLIPRAAVQLYWANALVRYVNAYGWEIRQRERVDTKGEVDLKAWTADQLWLEAHKAYFELWQQREQLGGQPLGALGEYLTPNDYPKGVRDTLRDVLTYLWASTLDNSGSWSPEQSNELYRLDFARLVKGDAAAMAKVALADPAVHPLVRLAALYDDLEVWHRKAGRREAALEARMERLADLRNHFTADDERAALTADLEAAIAAAKDLPWSAAGRAQLAGWVREAGDQVRARQIALEGLNAFPQSVGGQRCNNLVKSIEAPDYHLAGMQSDGVERRSLEVSAKNLDQVWFRAYRVEVDSLLQRSDYALLPQDEDIRRQMAQQAPVAKWSTKLPKTPDYQSHRTVVVPPLRDSGLYVVVASAREDFTDTKNRMVAQALLITKLVMTVRQQYADGSLEAVVVDGNTGEPRAGVDVELWTAEYGRPHQRAETKATDQSGGARFPPARREGRSHYVIAHAGQEWALQRQGLYFSNPNRYEVNTAMIYTDRSVYRPQQKVFFKAIAYHASADRSAFNTVPNTEVTVSLMDANHQAVETRSLKTNAFGSVAGDFLIPTGRLLGNWSIAVRGGSSYFRVEEYKRPTYEVSFKDNGGALKLNAPAALKGEARYYFGLPVTSGQVKWRVSRTPQYPWWWWEWGWSPPPSRTQVVAAGVSSLSSDGSFAVAFKPEADPKLGRDVSYLYQVDADVTDEGGETRSARKSVRLGNVAVEARASLNQGFVVEGTEAELTVRRTDLDGNGRAGKGTWRLVTLTQPEKARLPADEPLPRAPGVKPVAVQTEGDQLRPRWAPNYSPTAVMRAWGPGAEQKKGELTHDAKGDGKLQLGKLPAGAYRLEYQTQDEFGSKFETSTDFVVAGRSFPLRLPGYLELQASSVSVGQVARFLLGGVEGQPLVFELFKDGKRVERRVLHVGKDAAVLELPVSADDRGGYSVSVQAVRDFQVMQFTQNVFVPRDDKELKVEFATLRDPLRPGAKETFKVTVKGVAGKLEPGAAEVLAYMYDQSLDLFGPHSPPSALSLYPGRSGLPYTLSTVGPAEVKWISRHEWFSLPPYPQLKEDQLAFFDSYGIGGPGYRGYGRGIGAPRPMALKREAKSRSDEESDARGEAVDGLAAAAPAAPPAPPSEKAANTAPAAQPVNGPSRGAEEAAPVQVRANFSETAFFKPNLVPDASGAVSFEFQVPDSVTAWNVWAHAVTKDLRGGSVKATTHSVKDLMVRPYLPRFLREGDQALLKVVVNNASAKDLGGELKVEIFDPDTNQSLAKEFQLSATGPQAFTVKAGQSSNLSFNVVAPKRVGQASFRVVAKTGDFSDGELRVLPLLPSRMHLVQSRFATLRDKDARTLSFDDLAKSGDATRINEQLVVTVDAQLFFTVLQALPYLMHYPYECTEQTLNRFVSTGIVTSVFRDHPAVAKMAAKFAKRDTPLETFDGMDPNRKLQLEEAPWLEEAKGGGKAGDDFIDVLDPKVAQAERTAALTKLKKAQLANGGFPWFAGGPPSAYMTLYILHGFAKAAEFKVDVPRDVVQRAWSYVAQEARGSWKSCMANDGCWEWITFLNYVASASPEETGLTPAERDQMLDFSFKHWKQHAPYLKGYLALTLHRAKRDADAKLVFDSVMDSAKTTRDEGTFWQPEDRSWLWYNDSIETHAFALRTLTELQPKDSRRDGLVQWLLLNKKLNQWKSTRATAEVIYALVKYLEADKSLGVREETLVEVGPVKKQYVFPPDEYVGKKNQLVIPGSQVTPAMSQVKVSKATKGFQFASATWHFSTDQLPKEGSGDLFQVSRTYFKREKGLKDTVLKPLADGAKLEVGDELEVQLSIRSRAPAEYVHLKDPRGAGFEPEGAVSKFKWNLGIGWYEEYRDSSTNFFFENVPAGEFTFKYRVRASMSGAFRVGPAVMQSMYAPEFTAYSAGHLISVSASGQ
ncbi:MAG: hypothetical protein IPJ65_07610 [Archangiaceae bacterium]|nr:hypothetical protein [Archangiaceae bacterium]